MNTCPTIDILRQLLDEQLKPSYRHEVTEHVAECAVCQGTLDEMTRDALLQRSLPRKPADQGNSPALTGLIGRLQSMMPGWETALDKTTGDRADAAPTSYDPQAPLALSDFELKHELGTGGMGTVYFALQKSLNKPVAVKVLDRVCDRDLQVVQRFLREACAAAKLRHPNIVDVHGIGRTPDGGYFLVMDLVQGTDLESRVKSGDIDIHQVPSLMAAIADAVQHAHEHGVIHRDLKPSNILLDADRGVMVTDFGVAKLLGGDEPELTRHQSPLGTPEYMAPEQVDSHWGRVGPRTDVYGLGGILYYLLCGRHPFQTADRNELGVLARVVSEEHPVPPSTIRPDVPKPLEAISMKCLRKQPTRRYATAGQVADALRGFASSDDTKIASDTAEPPPELRASELEPPHGAVPLDSEFYLVRDGDEEFRSAIARRDSIVLIRGARQVGKTSLLARGLRQARTSGMNVVLTDFQKLNTSDLESAERLFLTLGQWIADSLDLDVSPDDTWSARRGASVNFERFLRREVLDKTSAPLVWALDEVDRLFGCTYSSDVFGLFRSWHNERALDPSGPWRDFTLAIAYATEAHLFISDMNQSPFNVGTRISLQDFTSQQVRELNERYASPLDTDAAIDKFYGLLAGHPYLSNRGLYELVTHGLDMASLEKQAITDEGFFGDHLRRVLVLLTQDDALCDAVRTVLGGGPCPSAEAFYRLRTAGVMAGESVQDGRLRCQLYWDYLQQHLSP